LLFSSDQSYSRITLIVKSQLFARVTRRDWLC